MHMWLRRLSLVALILACCVVALGAYTRLQDAGLGCPDWPGCYGHLVIPQAEHLVDRANARWPERPLEAHKAWPEMIHRYAASSLGLVIFSILVLCIRSRKQHPEVPLLLPAVLSALVVFQGLLGMWTVTLGLFPTIVMAHLLGGFTTLCLLFCLVVQLHGPILQRSDMRVKATSAPEKSNHPRLALRFGIIGIAVLILQISLGGWTAANYAATVCSDLPICQPGWWQHINLPDAFKFWGHGINDYEFATHLAADAKITIHVAHRFGAIVTGLYLGSLLIWLLLTTRQLSTIARRTAAVTLVILCLQILLGISNVVLNLPLLVAVAHNGVAAVLMMSLIFLNLCLYRSARGGHSL